MILDCSSDAVTLCHHSTLLHKRLAIHLHAEKIHCLLTLGSTFNDSWQIEELYISTIMLQTSICVCELVSSFLTAH